MTRTHALADSVRFANIPTVLSHVILGAVAMRGRDLATPDGLVSLLIAMGCAASLYAAGNLLNDWWDRGWDQIHRPERALPSGLFRPASYLRLATCLMVLACLLGMMRNPELALLCILVVAAIVVYTVLHKRNLLAVLPMAACRAAVPWIGVLAMTRVWGLLGELMTQSLLWYSAALFLHTAAISLSTRLLHPGASKGSWGLAWSLALSPLVCATMASQQFAQGAIWQAAACALPYAACVLRSFHSSLVGQPGRRVSWLLACFPMLDLACLSWILIAKPDASAAWLLVPLCAMGLALWLQRLTSAD